MPRPTHWKQAENATVNHTALPPKSRMAEQTPAAAASRNITAERNPKKQTKMKIPESAYITLEISPLFGHEKFTLKTPKMADFKSVKNTIKEKCNLPDETKFSLLTQNTRKIPSDNDRVHTFNETKFWVQLARKDWPVLGYESITKTDANMGSDDKLLSDDSSEDDEVSFKPKKNPVYINILIHPDNIAVGGKTLKSLKLKVLPWSSFNAVKKAISTKTGIAADKLVLSVKGTDKRIHDSDEVEKGSDRTFLLRLTQNLTPEEIAQKIAKLTKQCKKLNKMMAKEIQKLG